MYGAAVTSKRGICLPWLNDDWDSPWRPCSTTTRDGDGAFHDASGKLKGRGGGFGWPTLLIQAPPHGKTRARLWMLDGIAWEGCEIVDAAARRRPNHAREEEDGERHRCPNLASEKRGITT
jgi:hypothetical protein